MIKLTDIELEVLKKLIPNIEDIITETKEEGGIVKPCPHCGQPLRTYSLDELDPMFDKLKEK